MIRKFKTKVLFKEAEQWFKVERIKNAGAYYLNVGYFRHPDVSGTKSCEHCGISMHEHGWIDTLEGGHIVCPKDWIIKGIKGELYPCKPDVFEKTYDLVEEESVDKEANDLGQTEFDTECDVFYDECSSFGLSFDDEASNNTITPALKEFKENVINNYKSKALADRITPTEESYTKTMPKAEEPVYGKSPIESLFPLLEQLTQTQKNIENFFKTRNESILKTLVLNKQKVETRKATMQDCQKCEEPPNCSVVPLLCNIDISEESKLKTVKDFEIFQLIKKSEAEELRKEKSIRYVRGFNDSLIKSRIEAFKHIKKLSGEHDGCSETETCSQCFNDEVIAWIMNFFNITEGDLK